ncbi:MAG: ATP-binding protein [Cyanobacteriota bacterium]
MRDKDTVLQDVFNTISTGIFVVDVESLDGNELRGQNFRFVTINPAYGQLLSLPTTALEGLSPHESFSPDIADRFCANYCRCIEQRQSISYTESFEIEGRICIVLTTLFPSLEVDGRISRIIGSSQDITAFKGLEIISKSFDEQIETLGERLNPKLQQVKEQAVLGSSAVPNNTSVARSSPIAIREGEGSKELLSTLIKNAPVGIISTDKFGKILFVNPTYETICGYSSQELVGQTPPYPYWNLADLETINHEFQLAMSGEKENIELWFNRKNGERFLARLKPITIFDEQGNIRHHLATMEDITQYKQAEEELLKALEQQKELNEFKSRFLAIVSHEYRTPLTTILSSAELLERYTDRYTHEQQLKHYRRIQSSVQTLNQLVNDVLTLSKIEAGKQEFNPLPLDLINFCYQLVEELQLSITSKHNLIFTPEVDSKLTVPGDNATVYASLDAKLIRYIISNLLSNATKYSAKGSTVKFDLACEQEQAILRIQDEGIGIPVDDQKHLFKSFQRGSNVSSISGTGLGLAIVKSAVDLHGGNIIVESEVGVGTTVTVTLPLKDGSDRTFESTDIESG